MYGVKQYSMRRIRKELDNPHLNPELVVEFIEHWLKMSGGIVNKHTLRAYMRYAREFCERLVKARDERGEQHGYRLDTYLEEKHEQLKKKEINAGTYNQCVSAVRSVAKVMALQAAQVKGLDKFQQLSWVNQWKCVMDVIKRVKAPKRRRVGQWLTKEEVTTLVNSIDRTTLMGKRDVAMLALMFGAGLRREEIVDITWGQVQGDYNGRPMLTGLRCKGGKVREVPLAKWAYQLVADWCKRVGMAGDDKVMRGFSRDGKSVRDAMSTDGVYKRIQELCVNAGVRKDCPIRPHDARRTCAGLIIEGGGSIQQAQLQLGHSNPNITAHYLSAIMDTAPGKAGVDKVDIAVDGLAKDLRIKARVRREEQIVAATLVGLARRRRGLTRITLLGGVSNERVDKKLRRRDKRTMTDAEWQKEIDRMDKRDRLKQRMGFLIDDDY